MEEEEDEEDDEEDDDNCDYDDDEEELDSKGMEFAKNMKEEPGSDSGCTAVVALLKENKIYVANAGDSRCVVCRNGIFLKSIKRWCSTFSNTYIFF